MIELVYIRIELMPQIVLNIVGLALGVKDALFWYIEAGEKTKIGLFR